MRPLLIFVVAAIVFSIYLLTRRAQKPKFDVASEFSQAVAAARPTWKILDVKDRMLGIQPPELRNSISISIDRIAEVAAAAPTAADRPKAYAFFIASIDEAIQSHQPLSLEKDRARIRPRLIAEDHYQMLKRARPPAGHKLPELGIWVAYVIDSPNSVTFVTEDHLRELGIDQDALHNIAMENLQDKGFETVVRGAVEENKLNRIFYNDSYDAARLLLVPQYSRDGEALAAVIPDRDTLALLPAPLNNDWTGVVKLAESPASDRLILNRPVCVTHKGFELK